MDAQKRNYTQGYCDKLMLSPNEVHLINTCMFAYACLYYFEKAEKSSVC